VSPDDASPEAELGKESPLAATDVVVHVRILDSPKQLLLETAAIVHGRTQFGSGAVSSKLLRRNDVSHRSNASHVVASAATRSRIAYFEKYAILVPAQMG